MREREYHPTIVGPLILITVGVLLLLNQMGKLPWTIWETLWHFWPVILILFGLEILVKGSRSLAAYITVLLIAIVVLGGTIGYAMYHDWQSAKPRKATGTENLLEARQDADQGHITLKFGAGKLEIGALSDSPNFVEGEIVYGQFALKAEKEFYVSDGRAVFSLRAQSRPIPFWPPNARGDYWNIKFTPRIPLEMEIDSGAGKVKIDLSELKVTKLTLKTGVGETSITLPATAGMTDASIITGVGSTTVHIPNGVGARIQISQGIGSVRVDSTRFTRSEDAYVSTNYHTADNKLELEIKGGVGSITIK